MNFGKTSGAEMMLRAAGLGEVLDAANRLASGGAIEKILQFADRLPELLDRLERIENELARFADGRPDRDLSLDAGASARKPRSGGNGASDPVPFGSGRDIGEGAK